MPEVTERECQVESVVDGLERQFGQTDSLAMHVWCEEPTQGGPRKAHAERTSIGCMDARSPGTTRRLRLRVGGTMCTTDGGCAPDSCTCPAPHSQTPLGPPERGGRSRRAVGSGIGRGLTHPIGRGPRTRPRIRGPRSEAGARLERGPLALRAALCETLSLRYDQPGRA